jgi:Protein of unknown function (DUF3168)
MNAALDLQSALRRHLLAAPGVAMLIGSAVFDDVPEGTPCPYLHIAEIETRDWSTQGARGFEHLVGLDLWSSRHGRRQVLDIIEAVDGALLDAALPLTGHRLVNLRTLFWTVLQEKDRGLYRGLLRLRAVTEPLN